MQLTSAVKLAAANVYGYGLSIRSVTSPVCDALKRDGLYVSPEPLPSSMVDRLRTACDDIYSNYPAAVSVESNGSDRRIYGIDQLATEQVFRELQGKFLQDARTFYASDDIEQFVMSGDITFRREGLGSGSGWHRDSPYRHQFKVIVYLTDADTDRGPFEFVTGSHKTASVLRSARFLNKPLSEDRFTDDEVAILIENRIIRRPETVVGQAGAVVYADTRGLHRGRPLVSGRRRAVTFYIYHKGVPANVAKVMASAKVA